MKRLYQITNSLQPQPEEESGIKALAKISRVQVDQRGLLDYKTRYQKAKLSIKHLLESDEPTG